MRANGNKRHRKEEEEEDTESESPSPKRRRADGKTELSNVFQGLPPDLANYVATFDPVAGPLASRRTHRVAQRDCDVLTRHGQGCPLGRGRCFGYCTSRCGAWMSEIVEALANVRRIVSVGQAHEDPTLPVLPEKDNKFTGWVPSSLLALRTAPGVGVRVKATPAGVAGTWQVNTSGLHWNPRETRNLTSKGLSELLCSAIAGLPSLKERGEGDNKANAWLSLELQLISPTRDAIASALGFGQKLRGRQHVELPTGLWFSALFADREGRELARLGGNWHYDILQYIGHDSPILTKSLLLL